SMIDQQQAFLDKAEESLLGARSEHANRRYSNSANRAYYAAFQAAIAALIRAGIPPPRDHWGHEYVRSAFAGQLINRRKLYPAGLRSVLSDNHELRLIADYRGVPVTE